VTIAAGRYAKPIVTTPQGEVACPAVGLPPKRLKIILAQPLGTRSLVDAKGGATQPVLDPASVLKPGYLPAGYTGGQATWADVIKGLAQGSTQRNYGGPGGNLTVTMGSAGLNRSLGHVVEHTTVRGHPATVSYDSGFAQDILIAWSEDATHAATLYQVSHYDKNHPALSVAELVRIAQSLR
jgi:hypothetical protein